MFKLPRPTRRGRGVITAFAAFAVFVLTLMLSASAAQADRPARHFPPYSGLDRELRGGPGVARVVIHLRHAPTVAALSAGPRRRSEIAGRPSLAELRTLTHASTAARADVAAAIESRRHDALRELQPAVDTTISAQVHVVRAIEQGGGEILARDGLTGEITALIPRSVLPRLARRPDVAAITAAAVEKPLNQLSESSSITGAPSFWAAGFLGGRGINDTTGPDLALIGDRIYQHHPAFGGITFQTPEGVSDLCSPTIVECAHGTQVAGVAFSGGVSGTATPSDAEQRGIAPGVDSVLDADLENWSEGPWLLGFDQSDGISSSQPGAADPAEIVNASYGSTKAEDDTPAARAYDYFATGFGLTSAIGAGNAGPQSATVASPCIAYDSICTGAVRLGVGQSATDMTVPDWSSRGPTIGGRKKPDLVAIGTVDTANPNWQTDGNLWGGVTGTSFAAPQVAGAAALLAGSGVTHHLAHKAILINSARQGRRTPTDPMGTQIDWQPDWGWGALDLAAAFEQRSAVVPSTQTIAGTPGHHTVAEIAEGDVHFYSATTEAAGDRATLVWDRRAVGCLSVGCPEGSYALTLTDLALSETTSSGATIRDERPSAIDNVEQVRSPGAAPVLYKVKARSAIDGAPAEPYALAARRPLNRLATPRPRVNVTLSATEIDPGRDVTVDAQIHNPSPDLAAHEVVATLALPAGADVLDAPATRTIGTLPAGGTSRQTWTVRFADDGVADVRVDVAATTLSELLPANGARSVRVDGTPPSPSIATPAGDRTDYRLPLAWGASDTGVGVASHDVEVSADGGPFTTWLTETDATAATYEGRVGSRYQFRARSRDRLGNLSGWVIGAVASVVAPPPPPASPAPEPTPSSVPPALKTDTILRIAKAGLRRGHVTASGTITRRATGRVSVSFTAKRGGRRQRVARSTAVSRGRWSVRLPLRSFPRVRSGRLTVAYAGGPTHRAATVTRTVRR